MYKARIMGLNSFTVVEWDADGVVFPRQSELFDQISARWGKFVELDPIDREQELSISTENYDESNWITYGDLNSYQLLKLQRF